MKKHINKYTLMFIISMITIILGFAGLFVYQYINSSKLRTYNATINSNDIYGTMTIPSDKKWIDSEHHPDKPYGAQYDFVIFNNSDTTLQNWTVDITLSAPFYIDSSWNGTFTTNENHIHFTPQTDKSIINSENNSTFGAVIYSSVFMVPTSYTISGYTTLHITRMPLFWILIVFLITWFAFLLAYIIFNIHLKYYLERQMKDAQIIKQSISTFVNFIDAKDPYTKGHSFRVAEISVEIGRRMGLLSNELDNLYYTSILHDCGKIGISDSILKKPDRLTADEYDKIKSHTLLGDKMLANFTAIPGIREGAHYHHERFDGKGYPDGLIGKNIPLYARIICIADAYDAMNSNRCYRNALSTENIVSEFKSNMGKQFDPDIVPYMLEMIFDDSVNIISKKYPNS